MYTEEQTCGICTDGNRDSGVLCVVETPADLIAIENTMEFKGKYFVLMGRLSPIDGIGPEELKIDLLFSFLQQSNVREVILAVSPTVEGEATVAYIASLVESENIKSSRIAYGVPMGGELEYVDSNTLIQALNNRNPIDG
jgi:recombination protein RecR